MLSEDGKLSASIPINGTMYGWRRRCHTSASRHNFYQNHYTSGRAKFGTGTHPSHVRSLEHAHFLQCDWFALIHRSEHICEPAAERSVFVALRNSRYDEGGRQFIACFCKLADEPACFGGRVARR
jgi:hypothetical protein